MYMIKNITDAILMKLAELYCWSWYNLRCRLLRRIDDLEYVVSDYPSEVKAPFFSKSVVTNDEYCKTTIIKFANVMIEYSVIKFVRAGEDVFEPAEFGVVEATSKRAANEINNADVIQLTKWKEKHVSRRQNIIS